MSTVHKITPPKTLHFVIDDYEDQEESESLETWETLVEEHFKLEEKHKSVTASWNEIEDYPRWR